MATQPCAGFNSKCSAVTYKCLGHRNQRSSYNIESLKTLVGSLGETKNLNDLKNAILDEIKDRQKSPLYNETQKTNIDSAKELVNSQTNIEVGSELTGSSSTILDLNDLSSSIIKIRTASTNLTSTYKDENTYQKNTSTTTPNIKSNMDFKSIDQQTVYNGLLNILKDCICYSDCTSYFVCRCYGNCGCNY